MRLTNILILVFLLSAFAIGSSLYDTDFILVNEAIDNVSITIQNVTLDSSKNSYTNGMFTILEKLIHFVGVAFTEVMRMGITFGQENPDYFEPIFIFKIIKLLVWLTIISLLIQPLFYLIVIIVLCFMWLWDKFKNRKNQSETRHK